MKYDALNEEKGTAQRLLGDAGTDRAETGPPDPQAQWGFWSEEKQDQVAQIFEKYNQLRRKCSRSRVVRSARGT